AGDVEHPAGVVAADGEEGLPQPLDGQGLADGQLPGRQRDGLVAEGTGELNGVAVVRGREGIPQRSRSTVGVGVDGEGGGGGEAILQAVQTREEAPGLGRRRGAGPRQGGGEPTAERGAEHGATPWTEAKTGKTTRRPHRGAGATPKKKRDRVQ